MLLYLISYIFTHFLVVFPDLIVSIIGYILIFDVYIYSVLLHGLYGQTVGKMILSVKVVNYSNEKNISFWQAFLRDCVPVVVLFVTILVLSFAPVDDEGNLPSVVDSILIFSAVFHITWFLVEVITMLLNDKRRALHDFIAGTVVIRI